MNSNYTNNDEPFCSSHVKFRWNDDSKNDSKEVLEQKLYLLDKCITDNDLSDETGIDNCVTTFVQTLSEIMSDFHKVASFSSSQNTGKRTRNIDNVCNHKPWFNDTCKKLYGKYRKALFNFNACKSSENHTVLLTCKREYKKTECKVKRRYLFDQSNMVESIRKHNPKEFYSRFKKKKHVKTKVSLSEFTSHFKSLCGETNLDDTLNSENDCDQDDVFEELNVDISFDEINEAIKGLKRNKSHSSDGMLNEYFIEYADLLMPFLHNIFNSMFKKGCFPSILCNALIVPVHKKGSISEPKNYRGISLISCMSKLFTSILNSRLLAWSDTNDIVTDAQFGFRPKHSTVDAIFALNTIIGKFLRKKLRLYCCFIDFKQAFDSVDRNKLWNKISRLGIRGKILQILKSLYSNIKTSVLLNGNISEPFISHLGLLQGEIISPILFSFYVNDCEMDFLKNGCDPTELQDLSLFLLMYADDMVIFSQSISGLQSMLNSLSTYTAKWSLSVNVEKTKIVVFRNGGYVKQEENWFYNDIKLEVVDEFCYLGILLNYNGKFLKTQKKLSLQCRKAMFSLKRKCNGMNFNHKTLLSLFDTYVSSIAFYGCEIWGCHSAPDIENVRPIELGITVYILRL